MSDKIYIAGLGEGPQKRGSRTCSCLSHDARWKWLRMDVCVNRSATPLNLNVVNSPMSLLEFLKQHIPSVLGDTQENVVVIPIDARGRPVGVAHLHRGARAQSLAEPAAILQMVLAAAPAYRFILLHNHPSGDPAPSGDDADLNARIKDAARIVGFQMIDFVIVSSDRIYSFAEHGRL